MNDHQHSKQAELAIDVRGLVKRFGEKRAIDGIDLRVKRGSIYGVLGPNGAGKTTTVRILATLLQPDDGEAHVLGYNVAKDAHRVRERICLTGQFASVDEDLTGRENLVLLSLLLGMKRAEAIARSEELLHTFDLFEAKDKQVKSFSGGMRRRLDIAASLLRVPELLFLDEPTTGLDPRSRNQVWEIIRGLASNGTTILLTTQYLEEADQLAERIAVIDHGRVIAEGTPAELKRSVGTGMLHVRLIDAAQREQAQQILASRLEEEVVLDAESRALTAKLSDTSRAAAALAELSAFGIAVSDFSVGQPSLDEVFFALTGKREEHLTEEEVQR
ncbi:MAG TPA: ATP-binding cassette domain-containing protein [Candidatus Kapabacteria bacterium]|nr:ATP-binding cassette domain-containing protein [Candidatus Kapabacteria bacterium]